MKDNRRESGQSIIIIAFIVLVILALLALVVDIGNAYAQRRVVQNAVDAAAMAGATMLATQGPLDVTGTYRMPGVNDTDVEASMRDYAEINGLDRNQVQGIYVDSTGSDIGIVGNYGRNPVPVNAMGVRVAGDLTFATYFAHLLGVDEITVNAPSAAYVLTGPCSGSNLFPVALIDSTFCAPGQNPPCSPQVGTEFTVWDKNNKETPGNFGWIYWVRKNDDGSETTVGATPPNQTGNTTNLSANIVDTTRSGNWQVGDLVAGSPGVNLQPVFGELADYIQGSDPPDAVIPIYDYTVGQGQNTFYNITQFAAFQLTCVWQANNQFIERNPGDCAPCAAENDKCIRGYFVTSVIPPFNTGCADNGVSSPSYRMPTQP